MAVVMATQCRIHLPHLVASWLQDAQTVFVAGGHKWQWRLVSVVLSTVVMWHRHV